MPRIRKASSRECIPTAMSPATLAHSAPDEGLQQFWDMLTPRERQQLLKVNRKELFKKIRSQYCSRCFGLFQLRYDELRNSATLECPACHECYAGLVVAEDGAISLEEGIIKNQPFTTFAESQVRERERELQFMTGDICGSGWQKKPGQTMCRLHTSPVPYEALIEYWTNLPDEHKETLFSMREEDFVAELDAHMKYQLKICKDCRSNVMRAFKELKPGRETGQQYLQLCDGLRLTIVDSMVCINGTLNAVTLFEKAEEVEDQKTFDPDDMDDLDGSDSIRHAETPELAREALQDSVVLIFKAQVEVAFREQTAGHNALLLFVHLSLQVMEQSLANAYKELSVKKAEAELLELLEEDSKKTASKSAKKKQKKAARLQQQAAKALPPPEPVSPKQGCASCIELQTQALPTAPASPQSPRRAKPASPGTCGTHSSSASPCLKSDLSDKVTSLSAPKTATSHATRAVCNAAHNGDSTFETDALGEPLSEQPGTPGSSTLALSDGGSDSALSYPAELSDSTSDSGSPCGESSAFVVDSPESPWQQPVTKNRRRRNKSSTEASSAPYEATQNSGICTTHHASDNTSPSTSLHPASATVAILPPVPPPSTTRSRSPDRGVTAPAPVAVPRSHAGPLEAWGRLAERSTACLRIASTTQPPPPPPRLTSPGVSAQETSSKPRNAWSRPSGESQPSMPAEKHLGFPLAHTFPTPPPPPRQSMQPHVQVDMVGPVAELISPLSQWHHSVQPVSYSNGHPLNYANPMPAPPLHAVETVVENSAHVCTHPVYSIAQQARSTHSPSEVVGSSTRGQLSPHASGNFAASPAAVGNTPSAPMRVPCSRQACVSPNASTFDSATSSHLSTCSSAFSLFHHSPVQPGPVRSLMQGKLITVAASAPTSKNDHRLSDVKSPGFATSRSDLFRQPCRQAPGSACSNNDAELGYSSEYQLFGTSPCHPLFHPFFVATSGRVLSL